MSATRPLSDLIPSNCSKQIKLSKYENFILEINLFKNIWDELIDFFRTSYKPYFKLIKFPIDKETSMLKTNCLSLIIKDILLSGEYTLSGLACYTQTSEDVISDIVMGRNLQPSLPLSLKIIDLHRSIRPKLYSELIKKILEKYQEKNHE